jgi:hypothetical protein
MDTKGLAFAQEKFDEMNVLFSAERGWAVTAEEIYRLFAEKRKEEHQRQREEKLEELRESAPKFVMANTNNIEAKAVGKAEVEQMDVEVKSPGNNIARIINLGDSKDDE